MWEVKTYNFNNWKDFFYDVRIPDDIDQAEIESKIAHACNFSYWYTVGDEAHPAILEEYSAGFYPGVVDNIEVDPANYLKPDD